MTSQTPLVTQPVSKCLVIGLCSPGFIGGAPTYLCQRRRSLRCELFRALLKVERRANDGMRTSEHLIWTRPRASAGGWSLGSEQRAATQQRWELHTVSASGRLLAASKALILNWPVCMSALPTVCEHVLQRCSRGGRQRRSLRWKMKQHKLKCCSAADENLRLPVPCYIFSWYVKWWGMKSIHQLLKWFFPFLYKRLFWSHDTSQES